MSESGGWSEPDGMKEFGEIVNLVMDVAARHEGVFRALMRP
jgi:hypothetical protein